MTSILDYISGLLIALPAVVIAIGFHESAHAFMAYKQGDMTAKNLGRLTINPLSHLDPLGFICLFLFHFGWAKPVPINPNNFKNPKKGTVLTALAGPVMNVIIAFIFCFIYIACSLFVSADTVIGRILMEMVFSVISVNIGLAVFNLLPIPPLDGAKIFGGLLPKKLYFKIMEHENIIQLVLLLLLFTGVLSFIISPLVTFLFNLLFNVASIIFYYVGIGISYLIGMFL